MLPKDGYALVEDELPRRELDDEILSKENEFLQQRLMTDDFVPKVGLSRPERKLNSDEYDINSNYMDINNNSSPSSSSAKQRNKSELNVDVQPSSTCPGLATSAVAYKTDWCRFIKLFVIIIIVKFRNLRALYLRFSFMCFLSFSDFSINFAVLCFLRANCEAPHRQLTTLSGATM